MKKLTDTNGFSMLEMMIVLAIVGILAAIGMPAYVSHVYKTRETIAHQYILDVQAAEEKFYAMNDSYTGVIGDLDSLVSFDTADTQYYILSFLAAGTNTYTAQIASDINQDGVYSNIRTIGPPPAEPTLTSAGDEGFSISLIPALM